MKKIFLLPLILLIISCGDSEYPEARPGPLDAAPLFDRFSDIVNKKVPTNKVAKSLRGDN